jgi:hypothetical protein
MGSPPVPALPLQPQLSVSTHSKPAPQSAATVHGAAYFGMHALCVVSVHSGGAGGGAKQSAASGGHGSSAGAPPLHTPSVCSKQTMSSPQSASDSHAAPGTHSLIS